MRVMCFVLLAAVGCGTDDLVEPTPVTISFASPAPGSSHMRTTLGDTGALVATVPVALDVGGDVARVALRTVERELGDVTEDRRSATTAQLRASGMNTLTAVAYDADGGELATASVDVNVVDAEVADCKGWLDLYLLDYTVGPTNPGIADVTRTNMGDAVLVPRDVNRRRDADGKRAVERQLVERAARGRVIAARDQEQNQQFSNPTHGASLPQLDSPSV